MDYREARPSDEQYFVVARCGIFQPFFVEVYTIATFSSFHSQRCLVRLNFRNIRKVRRSAVRSTWTQCLCYTCENKQQKTKGASFSLERFLGEIQFDSGSKASENLFPFAGLGMLTPRLIFSAPRLTRSLVSLTGECSGLISRSPPLNCSHGALAPRGLFQRTLLSHPLPIRHVYVVRCYCSVALTGSYSKPSNYTPRAPRWPGPRCCVSESTLIIYEAI